LNSWDGVTIAVSYVNAFGYYMNNSVGISGPSNYTNVYDTKVNPTAPDRELLVIFQVDGKKSVFAKVDVFTGKVKEAEVKVDGAACLVTGWKDFVLVASDTNLWLFDSKDLSLIGSKSSLPLALFSLLLNTLSRFCLAPSSTRPLPCS